MDEWNGEGSTSTTCKGVGMEGREEKGDGKGGEGKSPINQGEFTKKASASGGVCPPDSLPVCMYLSMLAQMRARESTNFCYFYTAVHFSY